MKIQYTTSKSTSRFHVRMIFWLVLFALATFAIPSSVLAQEQGVITLMPTVVRTEPSTCASLTIAAKDDQPTCKIVFNFQTGSLPVGAKFTAASLMLVGKMRAKQTITVYMNDEKLIFGETTPSANESFPPSKRSIWQGTTQVLDKLNAPPVAAFSLILQTNSTGLASQWDWHDRDGSDRSGSRPRLVLAYNVPGRPTVVQTGGVPSTQSPALFLPTPPAAAQFTSRAVSNVWSYVPAFYKGRVYLMSQNGSQLQALPALGAPPIWSVPLTNPGQHLVLTASGRIYVMGNNQILVYQFDPSNTATPAVELKTLGGQPLSPKSGANLNAVRAPAVGADGSLYFVNGQEVYGLNPDLQELWKVTLTTATPGGVSVGVGPSGRFVYLISKGEGLVAIDAQTGERVTIAAPTDGSQSKLADNRNITFHAPVVIRHPDGTEKIYVAANSANDGVLANFDNSVTRVGQSRSGTITAGWQPLPGLWSQPIPDQLSPGTTTEPNTAKKIYAVNVRNGQGSLKALAWLAGSEQTATPSFAVSDSSDLLNAGSNGGSLAIDKDGNVLVWNGTDLKLYVFKPSGSVTELPLAPSSGITVGSRVLFGSDGTLYAVDSTNTASRTLRAIVPQYTLADSSSPILSSPTHLRVDGTANKDTTLSASGNVIVGAEFKVKPGASLTIRTNVP